MAWPLIVVKQHNSPWTASPDILRVSKRTLEAVPAVVTGWGLGWGRVGGRTCAPEVYTWLHSLTPPVLYGSREREAQSSLTASLAILTYTFTIFRDLNSQKSEHVLVLLRRCAPGARCVVTVETSL